VTAIVLALLIGSQTALAQRSADRAETFEFGVQIANFSGEAVEGVNGASIDVSNDTAIGIVGGYNFTDRFALVGELTWADPSYVLTRALDDGTGLIESVSAELDVGVLLFKAVFNFLDGPFTPFVELGAGWIRVDSNVVDGPPTTGCWWDPWWGYVCTSWYDTYADTRTAISYAAGIRWDLSDDVLLRASYGLTEMDSTFASADIELDELRVEFAWKF
jgi:opacity protein-like surface antigen